MKKWMTKSYGTEIIEVEVLRETNGYVYVPDKLHGERRERKDSDYHQYHSTWEAARDHLLQKAKARRERHAQELQIATDHIVKLLEMTPPEVTA